MSSWPCLGATSFSSNGSMFLEKGWKTFVWSRNLKKGDDLIFRYDGDESLGVRAFDSDGDRVGCCMESSNSDSCNSGEEADSSDDGA